MAFDDYNPNVDRIYYEMWEEGGDLIVKLPVYAVNFKVPEAIFVDDVEYKVEAIEHRLISMPDWTVPPEVQTKDMGFDTVLCKVWVSVVP